MGRAQSASAWCRAPARWRRFAVRRSCSHSCCQPRSIQSHLPSSTRSTVDSFCRQARSRSRSCFRRTANCWAAWHHGSEAAPRSGLDVVVTGANGWLGRHLVAALLDEAAVATVTALVRDPDSAGPLWTASDLKLRVANVADPSTLATAVAGADL